MYMVCLFDLIFLHEHLKMLNDLLHALDYYLDQFEDIRFII